MSEFAKLFNTEKRGQICVIMQGSDEPGFGAEIKVFIKPKGLGVCALSMQYKDTDSGWDNAGKFFDSIDEEKALSITDKTFEFIENENGENAK